MEGLPSMVKRHFTPKWVKTIGAGLKIQWQIFFIPMKSQKAFVSSNLTPSTLFPTFMI